MLQQVSPISNPKIQGLNTHVSDTTKLHNCRLRIVRFGDLKILDTGLSDSTVKIEHVGLRLLVPIRLAIVVDRDLSQIGLVEVAK